MRNHASDVLTAAIDATDLPKLVHELYPDSKAIPGRAGVYFASWRGNSDTPAFSVSRVRNRWLWRDHATGEGGSAFEFLVGVAGMDRQEAANYLVSRAGLTPEAAQAAPQGDSDQSRGPRYQPISQDDVAAFLELPLGMVPPMKGRGFSKGLLERYNIRADGHDALIPITNPEGVIMQVKRRVAHEDRPGKKYRYEHKGHGGPAWCSDNSRQAQMLLIVEGELSAIIAHAALQSWGEDGIGVMGVAGAQSVLYPGLVAGKSVFIYADDDKPGEEARYAWAEAAHQQGAKSVHVIPPHIEDFCDVAGKHGLDSLADMLYAMRHAAEQVYGAEDRQLGTMTVREILESTRNYLQGGVNIATGFDAFDRETGGIRQSGVYAIGGLSSMGKSSALRTMLLQQVRDGGKVRVYSPDQPGVAIYRLLANLLSGVGLHEIRRNNFDRESIALWGDRDKATRAWWEAFEFVLSDIAPRFQVTEEVRVSRIVEDMRESAKQGVTMFGIDYMQMLSHSGEDGEQSADIMATSQALGIPVVATMQLAKYKYPASRKSALPMMSDIEGSGKYFQNSEMVMLVYNEEIYGNKYAGDGWEPEGDSPGEGRLTLVKDKEGEGQGIYWMRWNARLAAYTNPGRFNLERERKGLLD